MPCCGFAGVDLRAMNPAPPLERALPDVPCPIFLSSLPAQALADGADEALQLLDCASVAMRAMAGLPPVGPAAGLVAI